MNKLKHLSLFLSVLLINSCVDKTKPSNCDDPSFCVLESMPIMSQASASLAASIGKLTGDSRITKDTGWCGPVSSAMAFAALKRENPELNFNSVIDDAKNIRTNSSASANAGNYAEIIHYIGDEFETMWYNGGTYDSKRKAGFKNILSQLETSKSKYAYDEVIMTYRNNQYFNNIFNAHKPAFNISIFKYSKQDNGSYKIQGGHAITVNGSDEGHIKVYDPWGRVYNVDMVEDGGAHNPPLIQHIGTSSAGYLSNALRGSNKVKAQRISYLFVE